MAMSCLYFREKGNLKEPANEVSSNIGVEYKGCIMQNAKREGSEHESFKLRDS